MSAVFGLLINAFRALNGERTTRGVAGPTPAPATSPDADYDALYQDEGGEE